MSCRGRLVVHVVENGHSYTLKCNEYTLVVAVQKFIESMSGISLDDQLLLCSDMKLESHCPLSDYKLPSDEREVFLFNKSRMRSNSPPPAPEQVEIARIPDDPPLPPSSHNPHPLDDAPDPALKALPSYERQFIYHFQYGDAIYSRTTAKFATCKRLLQEQKVQHRALEIARGNLDKLYKAIHQDNYTVFMKCYSSLRHNHANILANFGRDVEKLRSIELPPPLQSTQIKCLLDFVEEEHFQNLWKECSGSHEQYDNKVSAFKLDFLDLKSDAEYMLSVETSFLIQDLELSIKDHESFIDEQKNIMQSLSKDVNTVKKLVEDCLSSSLLSPLDAVSALGPMYDGHDKTYLPKMLSCEREISSLLDSCKNKKNEMNSFVHLFMQKTAHIQRTIKDTWCRFSVLQEALQQLMNQFEQLKVLYAIGPAYRSCLAEVLKRKEEKVKYMAKAEQMVKTLASERDAEVRRRKEFLKAHSAYIPRDILASMGLLDIPNPCNVCIAPFDSNLLDIDFSGLERYAPESLLGISSKSTKRASLRGSLSMSSDDYPADEEILEGSELVEIDGTSKMEVENAKLKAELASKIALKCSRSVELDYDSEADSVLKNAADKTTEALHLKDEYKKHLESMLKMKQMECDSYEKRCESYEKRIDELEHKLLDQNMRGWQPSVDEHVPDFVISTTNTDDNQSEVSEVVMELQAEKSSQLCNAETKIQELIDEVSYLRKELDINQKMLDESQMKCAQLENCLHEAREEAQAHLCAAELRASEYGSLRLSSIKLHRFFRSLRSCFSSVGVAALSDSLCALASEGDDEGCAEFRECIQILADKVGVLSRHHAELLERSSKAEDANEQLVKELVEKELVNTLYLNQQLEKQAKHLEVDEIAAFVLNSSGHYEATNRACPHHYLSAESIALFSDSPATHPSYIVGQVTRVEGKIVKATPSDEADNEGSSSNPYGLAVGCEYFVVSVGMVGDSGVSAAPPS